MTENLCTKKIIDAHLTGKYKIIDFKSYKNCYNQIE